MSNFDQIPAHTALANQIDATLALSQQIAVLPDGPLDASELKARVSSLGQSLLSRVASGDTVAICAATDRYVIAAVTACLRLGYPVMICDPLGAQEETEALIRHSQCKAVFVDADTSPLVGHLPDIQILDAAGSVQSDGQLPPIALAPTALLVATSGTTDRPKIVALSHANLIAQFSIFREVYGFDSETRALNLLPFHHVDGLVRGPLLSLWFGSILIRPRRFSAQAALDVFEDLRRNDATHLITVPAMLRILHRSYDLPTQSLPNSMRFVLSSADHLDAGLWRDVERDFNLPVVNAYGLSEVVCDALIAGPDEATRIIGSIGAARGVEAKVLNEAGQECPDGETGELAIAGGTVMQGYFHDPDETAAVLRDGLFLTGDLVSRRPDGVFEFQGRKKNVVVVAGVTIHPEAITEVLTQLPDVAEAYAFGHHTETGEELVAAVCPRPNAHLEPEHVLAECRVRLAPERQPSRLVILPELPRRASGKVDRAAIFAAAAVTSETKSIPDIAAACFGVSVDDIRETSSPFDTPGWDSLAHMNFIETLEDTFDFTMSPADVAGLMSIADALEIVRRETGEV